jgi:hypothetical protein
MQYEVINLGTDQNPKNINLGINCSPLEHNAFIKLFKEYKDIFHGLTMILRSMTLKSSNMLFLLGKRLNLCNKNSEKSTLILSFKSRRN